MTEDAQAQDQEGQNHDDLFREIETLSANIFDFTRLVGALEVLADPHADDERGQRGRAALQPMIEVLLDQGEELSSRAELISRRYRHRKGRRPPPAANLATIRQGAEQATREHGGEITKEESQRISNEMMRQMLRRDPTG